MDPSVEHKGTLGIEHEEQLTATIQVARRSIPNPVIIPNPNPHWIWPPTRPQALNLTIWIFYF